MKDIIAKLYVFTSHAYAIMSFGKIMNNIIHNNLLETCAVDIVLSKSLHGSNVAIVSDNFENGLVRKLHESNNINILVRDSNVSGDVSPDVYLVKCNNEDMFQKVITDLNHDWYHQRAALYVIALIHMSKENLPTIFKVLWDYHIIHVLVTIEDVNEQAAIYTYLPYAAGRCGRDFKYIIKVEQCQSDDDRDVVKTLRKYDNPDLTNCTFNILAHHYPPLVIADTELSNDFAVGIERFLVELLLEKEQIIPNYTFVPETFVFGNILENFTVTGLMKKLHENEVDLLFGGFSLNYKRALLFDFMCIHLAFEDIFIPVTTKTGLVDRWKIVYIMFEYKVWLLITFAMLICYAILSFCNYLPKFPHHNFSELLKLFGNATQNVSLTLRENAFKNVIIIHWLWFIFLVYCYYQTRLTSYSTYRAYKPQITEYMSLKNYNLTPCFSNDIKAFMKSTGISIIHEKYLDTRSCQTAELALDELVRTANKYTVTIYYKYLWWASRHMKEKDNIYAMQDILKTHYAFFFKRGFPLLDKFERTMSNILEFGFVQAVKRIHRLPEAVRYANNAAGAFEVRLLSLYDLVVPFGILLTGLVFALLIFMVEIFQKS